MAAGMGTRLRPYTENTPKSLIKINGMTLLERQILNLREIGVSDITIVTGYLHNKFNKLAEKYNLKKIVNDKYEKANNIYSMYLARNELRDAFVIDADNYFTRNFLPKKQPETSLYFSALKENIENEWLFKFTATGRIYGIDIADSMTPPGYIMSGASYWTEKDGQYLARKIEIAVEVEKRMDIYWDDIAVENYGDTEVYIQKIGSKDIFEIDTIKDLNYLKNTMSIQDVRFCSPGI